MIKTQKLYDLYPYEREFDAKVLSVTEKDGLFAVVTDKTLFFPEEGGQACDRGTLGGVSVSHVAIKDGVITHFLSEKICENSDIHGKIDFDFRFRNMQNHSGEHIVSGLIAKYFGFRNVGFHLGSEDVTMDYDGVLDRSMLDRIEELANRAIYENIPIVARYPSKEELALLDYRSKIDLLDDIRIVTVEGYDICACCAPHVGRTGEIGIIKLLDFAKYKGGTRVHMHCGFDALFDYRDKYKNVLQIAKSLSSRQSEAANAVNRLSDENSELKRKLSYLSSLLAEKTADLICETDGPVIFFEESFDAAALRKMANRLVQKCLYCALFSGDDKNGYFFIVASERISSKEVLSELSAKLGGKYQIKGGGSDKMVQGTAIAPAENIENSLLKQ